jgi:hypothetical protein
MIVKKYEKVEELARDDRFFDEILNFFKDSEPTVLWFWNGSGIFKEPEPAVL